MIHKDKKDKSGFFNQFGYTIEDAEYLKDEYEKQAKQKYELGEYTLSHLNEYGQRIIIEIKLKSKLKNEVMVVQTSWMVYNDGKIINVTPYAKR